MWLKPWTLRGKAKGSHTRNGKLIFSLKLVFTQAYVKIIKAVCMHSWVVGVFCCKSGCRRSSYKRHVQINGCIFGGFICVPRCSCCFCHNRRSCKEAAVYCCSSHMKKLRSNCCRSASVRTWCAGSLVAGGLCCSDLPLRVCEMKPVHCVQLLLSEHSNNNTLLESCFFLFALVGCLCFFFSPQWTNLYVIVPTQRIVWFCLDN